MIVTARSLHASGTDQVIEAIPEGSEVILALDVDGMDSSLVPSVILPAFGGLSCPQICEIMLRTAEHANIVEFDFVEFCPDQDPGGLSAAAIARMISVGVTCAGQIRR